MQRREFLTLFGGTTITEVILPQLARAQTSTKRPLLAVLGGVTRQEFPTSFMEGLRELGYVEGGNIDVAYRFADGRLELFPALAEELIQLSPNVILAAVTSAAVAVRKLTQTIPIVCPLLASPIERGLIASMARPGGNVTGLMTRVDDLVVKQLELAAQLVPALGGAVGPSSSPGPSGPAGLTICKQIRHLPFRETIEFPLFLRWGLRWPRFYSQRERCNRS